MFEKRHADIIRSIQDIECDKSFTERNFASSEYEDSTGRLLPEYLMTRDGFTLLAMGFTGAKALQWKIKYIDAFEKL
ncbi:MAG: Rha family transcriptional regulator [Cloacibacillus porcorum]|nr:Rha family transcriptional regulator [Cloacibacillus porcorum]